MKKCVSMALALLMLLCLVGCQHTEQLDSQADSNVNASQSLIEPSGEERLTNIPIMRCGLETRNISVGSWDLSSNVFTAVETPAGTTSDPYSLYSLQWDGDKVLVGLQVYLEELNTFNDSFDLRPTSLDEIIKDGTSITLSDEGELMLSNGDKAGSISGTEVTVDGIGGISPAMMQGNALSTSGETVFYLQSAIGESGLYLICTAINTETMSAENYVVGDKPFPYSEVDVDAFSPNLFAEESGIFYFCLTDAVFSFDPASRMLSKLFTLDSLGLSNDTDEYRVQFSGVTIYKGCLIVESTICEQDIQTQKVAHLCSLDGVVLQSISWDCQKELIIFPSL